MRSLYLELPDSSRASSVDYAGYLNNYGNFNVDLARMTGETVHLTEAIRALEECLRRCPAGSPDRPGYLGNLARALRDVALARPEDRAAIDRAITASRDGVDAADLVSAELALDSALGWGSFAEGIEDWSTASEAWARAWRSLMALLDRQDVRAHKELWLRQTQGLAAAWAYTCVRLGDPQGAVSALESAQGVLLREGLERDRPAGQHTDGYERAVRASEGRVLLYVASAAPGGLAIVVRDGVATSVDLPHLSRTDLETALDDVRLDQARGPDSSTPAYGRWSAGCPR